MFAFPDMRRIGRGAWRLMVDLASQAANMIAMLNASAAAFLRRMFGDDFTPSRPSRATRQFGAPRTASSTRISCGSPSGTICNNFSLTALVQSSRVILRSSGEVNMICARSVVGLMILIAWLATSAAAQGTADIVGRVTDPSGGVLAGANMVAKNVETNITRSTVTSATGDYTFNALPVGTYEVRAELSGFNGESSRITLATGDRARVDLRLQVGAITQSIEVAAEVQQLKTDSSDVASQLNRQVVQNVPIVGRNIINIIQLTPGAAEGAATATISGNRPDDRRQTSAVSVNGLPENENRQMIDGVDNEERVMGGMGIKPSLEAIQEVNVKTNSYSAESGRTLSAVINITTKSGGNQFHGSGYEFVRNQNFDARNFFAPTRPLNHQNQFGGSLGGPIKKDKTFFFVDYDQDRIRNAVASVVTVPTAKMHNGDFSEVSTPLYDPMIRPRTPFPGNIIPRDRWDSRSVNLMALYPLPNLPGLANNFAYNG